MFKAEKKCTEKTSDFAIELHEVEAAARAVEIRGTLVYEQAAW